ncbi:hypothetical protein [uncultured Nostoc sp.]|uniref:hypothetical protein n=1 Tax=uncultured Nostoc sp. TaxID=340711 RepID=UPI0035C9A96F
MITTKSAIGVTSSSPGITLTLESTGVILGIITSGCLLAGVVINVISKMNRISFSVNEIQEALKSYASNTEKTKNLETSFQVHLQDYVNYKDMTLLDRNGLRERIDHKWSRTAEEFDEVKADIKELQKSSRRRGFF